MMRNGRYIYIYVYIYIYIYTYVYIYTWIYIHIYIYTSSTSCSVGTCSKCGVIFSFPKSLLNDFSELFYDFECCIASGVDFVCLDVTCSTFDMYLCVCIGSDGTISCTRKNKNRIQPISNWMVLTPHAKMMSFIIHTGKWVFLYICI